MKKLIGFTLIGLAVIGCQPDSECDGHSRIRPYCHNLIEEVPDDPQSISEAFKRYESYKQNVTTNVKWRLVNCKFEKSCNSYYIMRIHYHEVPVEEKWLEEHGFRSNNGRSVSVCK